MYRIYLNLCLYYFSPRLLLYVLCSEYHYNAGRHYGKPDNNVRKTHVLYRPVLA